MESFYLRYFFERCQKLRMAQEVEVWLLSLKASRSGCGSGSKYSQNLHHKFPEIITSNTSEVVAVVLDPGLWRFFTGFRVFDFVRK